MATYKGNAGVISVAGSGAVANVKTFSIDVSAATVETTAMGVTAATHLPTITSWTGSADVNWDPTDTDGQTALSPGGDPVVVKFQMTGVAQGETFYTGSAIVTGHNKSSSFDGLIEASITLQGTGALTTGTNP